MSIMHLPAKPCYSHKDISHKSRRYSEDLELNSKAPILKTSLPTRSKSYDKRVSFNISDEESDTSADTPIGRDDSDDEASATKFRCTTNNTQNNRNKFNHFDEETPKNKCHRRRKLDRFNGTESGDNARHNNYLNDLYFNYTYSDKNRYNHCDFGYNKILSNVCEDMVNIGQRSAVMIQESTATDNKIMEIIQKLNNMTRDISDSDNEYIETERDTSFEVEQREEICLKCHKIKTPKLPSCESKEQATNTEVDSDCSSESRDYIYGGSLLIHEYRDINTAHSCKSNTPKTAQKSNINNCNSCYKNDSNESLNGDSGSQCYISNPRICHTGSLNHVTSCDSSSQIYENNADMCDAESQVNWPDDGIEYNKSNNHNYSDWHEKDLFDETIKSRENSDNKPKHKAKDSGNEKADHDAAKPNASPQSVLRLLETTANKLKNNGNLYNISRTRFAGSRLQSCRACFSLSNSYSRSLLALFFAMSVVCGTLSFFSYTLDQLIGPTYEHY